MGPNVCFEVTSCWAGVITLFAKEMRVSTINQHVSFQMSRFDAWLAALIATVETHVKTHNRKKSTKCSQCDYASSQTINLRTHLEQSQMDAISVTFHTLMQAIWGLIWKYTVEKIQTNATNASSYVSHLWRYAKTRRGVKSNKWG